MTQTGERLQLCCGAVAGSNEDEKLELSSSIMAFIGYNVIIVNESHWTGLKAPTLFASVFSLPSVLEVILMLGPHNSFVIHCTFVCHTRFFFFFQINHYGMCYCHLLFLQYFSECKSVFTFKLHKFHNV